MQKKLFVILCSGRRRTDDLTSWISRLADAEGIDVEVLCVDPVVDPTTDLKDSCFVADLLQAIVSGRVVGIQGGPPCSPFSKVRHRKMAGGPRPLCSRSNLWVPFEFLTKAEKKNRHADEWYLLVVCLYLMLEAALCGI